jgi:hypothetical protein
MAVRWHHRLFTLALGAWLLLMGGCASQQTMPWGDGAAAPAGQAVVLMSVTLRNAYKDRYQPELSAVLVQREDVTPQPAPLVFPTDARAALPAPAAAAASAPAGGTWLVRLALEPGRYTLRSLAALGRAFPAIGHFSVPLHAPLQVAAGGGVHYLGAIDATVRERVGDEFRAGPVIPLLDQALAGASGGTFDVVISDRYDRDLALFRQTFAALGSQPVSRAVLPPFDRARAQAWWQAH